MIPFKAEIDNIKEQIISKYNPKKIILFGSCARGRAKLNSDIDICIILDYKNKRELLMNLTMNIDSEREIDFIVYTESKWKENLKDSATFANLINRTGVELYG